MPAFSPTIIRGQGALALFKGGTDADLRLDHVESDGTGE